MVFLGIVLAAIAVAVAAGIVAENSSSASLRILGHDLPGVHTGAQVFLVGCVVATFVIVGLGVSWLALMRSLRLRRELRDLRDDQEESMSALVLKNEQLQRELARSRAGVGADAVGAPTGAPMPASPQRGRGAEPDSPFFDGSA